MKVRDLISILESHDPDLPVQPVGHDTLTIALRKEREFDNPTMPVSPRKYLVIY